MDIKDITEKDFNEPYDVLVYKIGIKNTIKFAANFKGRQISFKKRDIKDSKYFPEISILLGEEAAIKIVKLYAGSTIYFPEIKKSCKEKIRILIEKNFNGGNYDELAKEFGYSVRQIYRILGKRSSKHSVINEHQLNLFDKL